MEKLVRTVFSKYNEMLAEMALYRKWLVLRDNPDARDAYTFIDMKITAVQSWLNLLTADERFVIEKHLLEALEWPRVTYEFAQRWNCEFTRTERSLVAYQASALRKIVDFCKAHEAITMSLFGDMLNSDTSKE